VLRTDAQVQMAHRVLVARISAEFKRVLLLMSGRSDGRLCHDLVVSKVHSTVLRDS
jgi:hypothetical protein